MERINNIVLNMPGPSAVGRDFIIESLLNNQESLKKELKLPSLNIQVLQKVTTRESRNIELTKKPISEQEFDSLLEEGRIIASYVLESNGKRYGYEITAFDTPGDIVVADASVYQTPELKEKLGDKLYSLAVVSSREYREKNIRGRIACGKSNECEEEIMARLNLGDAHVALLMLMAGKQYQGLINNEFSINIDVFMRGDNSKAKAIENFSGSENVVELLKKLRNNPDVLIEDVLVRSEKHHVPAGESIVGSLLWKDVVQSLKKSIARQKSPVTA